MGQPSFSNFASCAFDTGNEGGWPYFDKSMTSVGYRNTARFVILLQNSAGDSLTSSERDADADHIQNGAKRRLSVEEFA